MGHGINVSAKHDLQVPAEMFDKVTSTPGPKLKIAG